MISQANHYCAQCWKCLSRPEMCSVWTDRNIKSRCRQTWKRVTNTGTASILCWYSYWSASLILGDFTIYYASGSELSSEMLSVQDKANTSCQGEWVCIAVSMGSVVCHNTQIPKQIKWKLRLQAMFNIWWLPLFISVAMKMNFVLPSLGSPTPSWLRAHPYSCSEAHSDSNAPGGYDRIPHADRGPHYEER